MTATADSGRGEGVVTPSQTILCPAKPLLGAADRAQPGAAASGLVNYTTSHTSDPEWFFINSFEGRLRKMKKAVLNAARLIHDSINVGGFRFRAVLLTLTYRGVDDWRPQHIADFNKRIREHLRRRGVKMFGVWVAELQQRGAVHYHLILWLPIDLELPMPDKCGWWPHGHTKIEAARNGVGYVVKYASKANEFQSFPKGCRLHGASGLDATQRKERRWWQLPLYVRKHFPDWKQDIRRFAGGFTSRLTGELLESQFQVVGIGKWGPVLEKRIPIAVAIGCAA